MYDDVARDVTREELGRAELGSEVLTTVARDRERGGAVEEGR